MYEPKEDERNWQVRYCLKRKPKFRHSEWLTKDAAITKARDLMKKGYHCAIFEDSGLDGLLICDAELEEATGVKNGQDLPEGIAPRW